MPLTTDATRSSVSSDQQKALSSNLVVGSIAVTFCTSGGKGEGAPPPETGEAPSAESEEAL